MGFLKLSNAVDNKIVNCDNVVDIQAGITGSGATAVATVDIQYAISVPSGTSNEGALLKTAITYAAPGTSNEYDFTAAELQESFEDAIISMNGSTNSAIEGPVAAVKVTATGAALANAVPTIVIKHGADLT